MVKQLTGGYKVTYHPEGPDGEAWEADFTPPWPRLPMIPTLEERMGAKFPKPTDLGTEGETCVHTIVINQHCWIPNLIYARFLP